MSVLDDLEQARGLTQGEKDLASYILANPDEVTRMSIAGLASSAYSSNATIIRLCHKLGADGWRDFRVALASDLERRRQTRADADPTTPFGAGSGPAEVMEALASLTREAVADCNATLEADALGRVATLVAGAARTYVFAVGDSLASAEAFANQMVKVGVQVIVADRLGERLAHAQALRTGDVVVLISYTGKILADKDTAALLRIAGERGCHVVWVSAVEPSRFGTEWLRLPGRERRQGKIATFYSQTCIRHVLNCVYASVWALDYEGNRDRNDLREALDGSLS